MSKADSSRGFWFLIATQFQGAFSDMTYKTVLSMVAVGIAATQSDRSNYLSLIQIVFLVPFLLFSMIGGFLADRFSKRTVTLGTKAWELGIMLLATLAAWAGSLNGGLVVLFLLSTQAALFGPTKYSILPELLPSKRLSWGNGILEMTTFVSIILGTVAGCLLVESFRGRLYVSGLILAVLSVVGIGTSAAIGPLHSANPAARLNWNLFGEVFHCVREARKDRPLWLAVIGSMYFWFLGLLLQTNILVYGSQVLHLGERDISYLMAALALGIGLGS